MSQPELKEEIQQEEKQPSSTSSSSSSSSASKTLSSLQFDNKALRVLPVGRDGQAGTLFSLLSPTPLQNPHVVCLSPSCLALLDLSPSTLQSSPDSALYLSGNKAIPGSQTASHCYCGHQFGAFAGQLGDGAVCYLGEVINSRGERWEIQFKGSGLTPYSRSADGRKVLRSSMREFLASEAMAALGIPTTRAASLITSDSYILRDQFYSGNVRRERASVVMRVAETFIRFGSFEVCKRRDPMTGASGPCVGRVDVIRQLMAYVTETFYPQQWSEWQQRVAGEEEGSERWQQETERRDVAVYREIVLRTARLIAQWQCVGFVHGVMNTDNMSITGLSIDYGPYQFLDAFIPSSTSNTSDEQFRYAYERQPAIGQWDLGKLAEAFSLMWKGGKEREVEGLKEMQAVLADEYDREFDRAYWTRMTEKLGLRAQDGGQEQQDVNRETVRLFLSTLETTCGDFTNCFRILSTLSLHQDNSAAVLDYLVQQSSPLSVYMQSLAPRIDDEQLAYYQHVLASNPNVRDGSGLIAGELKRRSQLSAARQLGSDDAKMQRDRQLWTAFISQYRDTLLRQWKVEEEGERRRSMNRVNPKYVLRNWMAQVAIERAEAGDYSECEQVLQAVTDPFAVNEDEEVVKQGEQKAREVEEGKGGGRFTCRPPKGYEQVLCSCSS